MFFEGIVTYKVMSINGDSIARAAGATLQSLTKKAHHTMKVLSQTVATGGWKLSYIISQNKERGTIIKWQELLMSSCMSEIT